MNVLDVDLQRIGQQFNLAALADPRYKSSLSGHVVASVNGTALETMDLTASGALTESSVFGGRIPELTFESTIANGDLHVKANGHLEKIDAAIAAGRPSLQGEVTGDVDADVTLTQLANGVDANSIEGALTADLGPSKIGNAAIDRAYVSGDYRKSLADIYQLDVSGSDVVATGHGTLSLNETDSSGFWIHAEASHLESINTAMDSQHALTGIGTFDAVVGGNKKELTVNGTATGNGIKYDDYGALAASTKFSATIPNLDTQQMTVHADTNATFVDLPGLNVNELTAATDYRDKNVDFTLSAKQPQRSLDAGGSVVLHPDHNEVHLTAFDLQTQGMRWRTGQGHSPAIQWGGGTVVVKDFDLASGAQEIRAEGAFGKADSHLTVNLKDVDLGIVDAFLVRPQQLWGTVNAKAVVSGTSDAPEADAEFTIAERPVPPGAVRVDCGQGQVHAGQHRRRHEAAAGRVALDCRQRRVADVALQGATQRRPHRLPRRQQQRRSRHRPGTDQRGQRREGHASGKAQHDGHGAGPASRRRRDDSGRRVQSRRDWRRLQRHRRQDRLSPGPRAHRRPARARPRQRLPDRHRRSGRFGSAAVERESRSLRRQLQGARQRDGQPARQQQHRVHRHARQSEGRRRPRHRDRQHQARSDSRQNRHGVFNDLARRDGEGRFAGQLASGTAGRARAWRARHHSRRPRREG